MRALVTGSSGFVGRHMAVELKARGYEVDGVDIRPGEHTNYVEDAIDWFRLDKARVRQPYVLVVHCAYWVGGRAMIDGVPDVLSANVELDAALFRWALVTQPERILYFSSSAVYPTYLQSQNFMRQYGGHPLREDRVRLIGDMFGNPDARYGWAKLNGEMLVKAARESGLNVSVVRPFSGYGADQSLDYPFPSIVQRARTGDLTVWGPPGQTRDWIHISDVVSASLAVVESGTTDPVNLCTGVPIDMGLLAQMIYARAKDRTALELLSCIDYRGECGMEVNYLQDKPTGVYYRVGDPTRMLKYYVPKISIAQGIEEALTSGVIT